MSLRDLAIRVGYQIESGPLSTANEQVDTFKANAVKSETSLKSLGAQAGTTATQANKAAGNIVSGFDALDAKFRANQQSLEQIDRTLSANRALMAGAFAATAGTIGFAVKRASDFESSMSRVGALARANDKELNGLSSAARDLGATTVFSASQAAEGMGFLAMAGFEVSEIIDAMPGMLDVAAAAQLDLGSTADIVSNVLTGFDLQAEESGRVADVLSVAFTSANVDLLMLGDTMKYAGPVAAALGYSLEETAAVAGLLGNAGIQASQAGTTLRRMMGVLSGPTGAAADTLQKLGVRVSDAHGNMMPLTDIVEQLAVATEGMGEAQRSNAMQTIFGERAYAGVLALISQGPDKLREFTAELEQSGGAARFIAEKQLDNLQGSLKMLGSAFEEAQISIGSAFVPIIRLGANVIKGVLDVFNRLPGPIKTVVAAGLGLGAVLSGLLLAASFIVPQMIALGKAMPFLRTGFQTVIPAIQGYATSMWAAIAPMLPIIGIALGIAAAIGAVVLVGHDIVSFFQGKGGSVTGRIVEWAKNCQWLQKVAAGVSASFEWIRDRAKSFGSVLSGLGAIAQTARTGFSSMASQVKSRFGELVSQFRQNPIGFIIDFHPLTLLVKGVQAVIGAVKNWLADHGISLPAIKLPEFPDVLGVLQGWWDSVKGWITEKLDLGAVLSAAFSKALEMIPAPLRAIGEKILNFLPQSPAEEGPLRDLDKVGPGLVGTIASGIMDSIPVLDDRMRQALAGTMGMSEAPVQPLFEIPSPEPLSIAASSGDGRDDDSAPRGFGRHPGSAPAMTLNFEINVDARGATEETARKVAAMTRDEIRRVMEQLLRADYDSMVLEGE